MNFSLSLPNYISLLANLGGVLGLCTGFSLITAVELLYWFSIRIFSDKFCKSNKISDETSESDEESNHQEENKECDCETLKSQMKDLQARNAKVEARGVTLEASNAKLEASNAKLEASYTTLEASNAEIKDMLKMLMKSNSPTNNTSK